MINDVRNIVYTISNKENRGSISPIDFNNMLYTVVMSRFNSYLTEYKSSIVRLNKGYNSYGLADTPFYLRQLIDIFSAEKLLTNTTVTGGFGTFTPPSDCAYIETVFYNRVELDEVERSQWINLQGSSKARPTNDFPVYIKLGTTIKVQPNGFNRINVHYIRFPKRPKWTYNIVMGNPLFNPSAPDFQDIELHESELPNIVLEMCTLLGINLRSEELFAYIETLRDKDFQKKNNL